MRKNREYLQKDLSLGKCNCKDLFDCICSGAMLFLKAYKGGGSLKMLLVCAMRLRYIWMRKEKQYCGGV